MLTIRAPALAGSAVAIRASRVIGPRAHRGRLTRVLVRADLAPPPPHAANTTAMPSSRDRDRHIVT